MKRLFLLLALTAMIFATGLMAATPDGGHAVSDWGVPTGLAGLTAGIVWSVRKITASLDKASERSDAQLAKLCEVAHASIDESRESRESHDAARRAFIAAANVPSDTTIRPRHREHPKDLRTADDVRNFGRQDAG